MRLFSHADRHVHSARRTRSQTPVTDTQAAWAEGRSAAPRRAGSRPRPQTRAALGVRTSRLASRSLTGCRSSLFGRRWAGLSPPAPASAARRAARAAPHTRVGAPLRRGAGAQPSGAPRRRAQRRGPGTCDGTSKRTPGTACAAAALGPVARARGWGARQSSPGRRQPVARPPPHLVRLGDPGARQALQPLGEDGQHAGRRHGVAVLAIAPDVARQRRLAAWVAGGHRHGRNLQRRAARRGAPRSSLGAHQERRIAVARRRARLARKRSRARRLARRRGAPRTGGAPGARRAGRATHQQVRQHALHGGLVRLQDARVQQQRQGHRLRRQLVEVGLPGVVHQVDADRQGGRPPAPAARARAALAAGRGRAPERRPRCAGAGLCSQGACCMAPLPGPTTVSLHAQPVDGRSC